MESQITILNAIMLAMVMQAINAVFSEGMIFSAPGAWLERNAHFVWKMIMGCPVCMCPWYGAGIILALHLSPWDAISIVVAMGINWVISNMYPKEPEQIGIDVIPEVEPYEHSHTTTGL